LSEEQKNIPNFYSGNLWNAFGIHSENVNLITRFNYLLEYKQSEIENIINGLFLYDKVIIPTNDFLCIFSLLKVFGQTNLIKLLETGKIKFIRLSGSLGYLYGDGIVSIGTKDKTCDMPPRNALKITSRDLTNALGLSKIDNRLIRLIDKNTTEIFSDQIGKQIGAETILDVENNKYLKEKLGINSINDIDGVTVPKNEGKIKIFMHPELIPDQGHDPIGKIIEIAYANLEFYMSSLMNCSFSSTFVPVGHFLKGKQEKILKNEILEETFLKLLDFGDYPNIGSAVIVNSINIVKVLQLQQSKDVEDFKEWFHEVIQTHPEDIEKEAFSLHRSIIKDVREPRFSKLRFAVTNLLGSIPLAGGILGAAASSVDSFVISDALRRKSPLYFLDDLKRIIK
jgi:hypothetical protein